LEHAAGGPEDAAYLERLHQLREAKENLERTSTDGISPERAIEWLRALSGTWRTAEVPAERADLPLGPKRPRRTAWVCRTRP
jgi:hypothetical protein